MNSILQVLDSKGRDIWSITPDDSVLHAIKVMAKRGVGALLVMQDDDLVGIVSERDYARRVILEGKSSKKTAVSEIMSANVSCIRPDQTVEEAMALMTDKRIRHLPVVEDGSVVGVISIGDLVKSIIADQQSTIDELQRYITG